MPVVELIPVGTASPCAWVAASTSASVAPGSTRAVRSSASTATARICERSSSSAPSATARPAIWCPPLRTAEEQVVRRARSAPPPRRRRRRGAHDERRPPVDHRVPERARLVVARRPRAAPRCRRRCRRKSATAASETWAERRSSLRISNVICQVLPMERRPARPVRSKINVAKDGRREKCAGPHGRIAGRAPRSISRSGIGRYPSRLHRERSKGRPAGVKPWPSASVFRRFPVVFP